MIKQNKSLWILAYVISISLVFSSICTAATGASTGKNQPKPTPKPPVAAPKSKPTPVPPKDSGMNFTLDASGGKTVSLKSFRGKKVMLFFWSPFCSVCLEEMPMIEAIYKNTKRDAVLLALNVDDPISGFSFALNNELPYTVLADKGRSVFKQFNFSNIPSMVFIDKNGKVAAKLDKPDFNEKNVYSTLKKIK